MNLSDVVKANAIFPPISARIAAIGVTGNAQIGVLPPNATILYAIARETAGNDVTIFLGSTSGAGDIASSVALPAGTSMMIPITSFSNAWFSASAGQSIFINSAGWNNAGVSIAIYYTVGQ